MAAQNPSQIIQPQIGGSRVDTTVPSTEDWANIFGPNAYNIQPDANRNRKLGRLHIPDVLKGPNQWLTDRVDGLLTDATNSPFTTVILPYMYMEYPDRKIEWNVWTFDQGLASRVPYEAAARTLTQRKQAFSGYTVRQGLAITMEHNFMMSKEGIENFQNQVTQVVGSIQKTNDLDVHMALINAPSYVAKVRERYFLEDYLHKSLRDYVDNFGFVQKNMNAMDILIEDTKAQILEWGGEEPDFLLCPGRLTYQMTMLPEKTNYFTNGEDGKKLLKQGPELPQYRGLKVVKSKAFSLEDGNAPKDLFRRRVRVGEYYVGKFDRNNTTIELYDESSDSMVQISNQTIKSAALNFAVYDGNAIANTHEGTRYKHNVTSWLTQNEVYDHNTDVTLWCQDAGSVILIRPNIEHYMLGMVIGRGGIDHLGATLWGQTEMSVFDDGQHGVWGMTYKYHERAIVFNERNMHRLWDVSYDGYCGGKDITVMNWTDDAVEQFTNDSNDQAREFSGSSIVVVPIPPKPIIDNHGAVVDDAWHTTLNALPSPYIWANSHGDSVNTLATADLFIRDTKNFMSKQLSKIDSGIKTDVEQAMMMVYGMLQISNNHQIVKDAAMAATTGESTACRLLYQGTSTFNHHDNQQPIRLMGCGHHGPDYPGVAAVRNGKQYANTSLPAITTNNTGSMDVRRVD